MLFDVYFYEKLQLLESLLGVTLSVYPTLVMYE